MAAVKETLVTLAVASDGTEREFGLAHAERILALPDGGGWRLSDKRFKVDSHGRIVRRKDASEGAAGKA